MVKMVWNISLTASTKVYVLWGKNSRTFCDDMMTGTYWKGVIDGRKDGQAESPVIKLLGHIYKCQIRMAYRICMKRDGLHSRDWWSCHWYEFMNFADLVCQFDRLYCIKCLRTAVPNPMQALLGYRILYQNSFILVTIAMLRCTITFPKCRVTIKPKEEFNIGICML